MFYFKICSFFIMLRMELNHSRVPCRRFAFEIHLSSNLRYDTLAPEKVPEAGKNILTFPLCFLKIIVRLSFQKYPPYSKMEGILTLDDKRTQKIVNKPLSISDIMFSLAHASFPKSVFSILYTKHRISFLQTHQYLGS